MLRGFFLLVVDFFLLESFLLDVALRAVPAGFALAVVECDAFAGVFLPAFGARVVIVSDLAMAAALRGLHGRRDRTFLFQLAEYYVR